MFSFLRDKTKKSICKLINVPEECNSCVNFKYTVYKNVFNRYVITLTKHTQSFYIISVENIKRNPNTTEKLQNIETYELDDALKIFFSLCQKYITEVEITEEKE